MTPDSCTVLLRAVEVLKGINSEVKFLKQEDGVVRQNLKDTLVGLEEGCVGDERLMMADAS